MSLPTVFSAPARLTPHPKTESLRLSGGGRYAAGLRITDEIWTCPLVNSCRKLTTPSGLGLLGSELNSGVVKDTSDVGFSSEKLMLVFSARGMLYRSCGFLIPVRLVGPWKSSVSGNASTSTKFEKLCPTSRFATCAYA